MKTRFSIFVFFILCIVRTYSQGLDSPILIDPPVEKDVVTIAPSFTWSEVPNATIYDVQISADADFSYITAEKTSVSNSINLQEGLQPFTEYYWRVRARNSQFSGNYSSAFNFRTAGTPFQEENFIKSFIINLSANNQLNQTKANELLEKVNQAIDKINTNNYVVAVVKVLQFVWKVSGFVSNGDLNTVYGQRLINNSNSIINLLYGDNISNGNESIISKFSLKQNYPNPFNPATVIEYSLPVNANVSVKIYNLLGEEIVTLVDKYQEQGTYSLVWNALNMSSGIYIYKITAGNYTEAKKMILQK